MQDFYFRAIKPATRWRYFFLLYFMVLLIPCAFATQAEQKSKTSTETKNTSRSEVTANNNLNNLTRARLSHSRELEHKRTPNSRVYANPDQTYTTVYSSTPFYYKSEKGNWEEIAPKKLLENEFETTTEEDLSQMGSCFFPAYNTSSISLPIPEGHTILNTHLQWDFVSHNQAWMSEQRSYVSGPAGQTQVFQGNGNTEGLESYSTNSGLANGVSDGEITLTFHAARTWGGSECNTQHAYINRRYIEITHGEVEFGEGDVVINEYSASNRQMTDNFGNYEDWVELYNPSGNFVDLTGYYLSDNPGSSPVGYCLPGGIYW